MMPPTGAAACAAAVMVASLAAPAHSDDANYYGKHVELVADDLDCNRFVLTQSPGDDPDIFMGGECRVAGVRLKFATFRKVRQQKVWEAGVTSFIESSSRPGDYYFASDKGAIVLSGSFSLRAAQIGKRRIGATVVHIQVD